MKLSNFKKELKKRNISYDVFLANTLNDQNTKWDDTYLSNLIEDLPTFTDVIHAAFEWDVSPEGYDFWDDIYDGGKCISPHGEIFQDYAISTIPRSHTGSWSIGSSVLTTARKRKLFKLLAKDLGYKIEG